MSTGIEKLQRDLTILEAMAAEMDTYLKSDVLFWPLGQSWMPKLTLGGYLMRQHRLLALQDLLTEEEQARLETAVHTFNKALVEKIVRLEQKAENELKARIRQWHEYFKDLKRDKTAATTSYAHHIEVRAMIDAILDKLQLPPYQLDANILREVKLLDNKLSSQWISGNFVWPEEWQSAYSKTAYWWLYGHPR